MKVIALCTALLALTVATGHAQTVKPGMTADEVKAAWGEPFATRARGEYTYLIYASDCLPGCGSHDVVTLQNGKVIDAIARSSGRHFEGTATIDNKTPGFTPPPGTTGGATR